MRKVLWIIFIFSSAWVAAATLTWKDLQAGIDSWITGPPSLIVTSDESSVFKRLKSPEEKMQFIKIFWARRDPILRTRENEYKEEFYLRVEHANQNFAEGETPGWKTARGQVYILFGPPEREEKKVVPDSNRPALLWVYSKLPSNKIPRNEALLFVHREIKWVLVPPNADPGDYFGQLQREFDSGFRYQTIPGTVEQAFNDTRSASIIDEDKDYDELLSSVESTMKFGLAGIDFDAKIEPSNPPRVQVVMDTGKAPVYDAGDRIFAEFYFKQEVRSGDNVVASNEHSASFDWASKDFADLKEITVELPAVQAPPGEYQLWLTVQDRVSNVSETRKFPVRY